MGKSEEIKVIRLYGEEDLNEILGKIIMEEMIKGENQWIGDPEQQ